MSRFVREDRPVSLTWIIKYRYNMKKHLFFLVVLLASCITVAAENVKRCGTDEIPMKMRDSYIRNATELLQAYYAQLPLNIGDPMVQEVFAERFMQAEKNNYMPEFQPEMKKGFNFLQSAQYLQELDKTFSNIDAEEIEFQINNIKIDKKDFFLSGLVGCYVKATYKLDLTYDGKTITSRECEAYCLFPRASVSIDVRLLQVKPIKGNDYKLSALMVEEAADVSPPMFLAKQTEVTQQTDGKPVVVPKTNQEESKFIASIKAFGDYIFNPGGGMLFVLLFIGLMGFGGLVTVLFSGDDWVEKVRNIIFVLLIAAGCYLIAGLFGFYIVSWFEADNKRTTWLVAIFIMFMIILSIYIIKNDDDWRSWKGILMLLFWIAMEGLMIWTLCR